MLSQADIRDIGTIVQETIKAEVPAILQKEVPAIVRRETDDIREQVAGLTEDVSVLQQDVTSLDQKVSHLDKKVTNLEVLYEDLDDRFKADSELLRNNLEVKDKVDDHESRLTTLETGHEMLKGAVKEHSKALKPQSS